MLAKKFALLVKTWRAVFVVQVEHKNMSQFLRVF